MDNRVANSPVLYAPANNSLAAPRLAVGPAPVTVLNTTDSASFSSRPGVGDLDSIAAKVAELDQRIHQLEAQVVTLNQENGFPQPVGANNYAPAANANAYGPAANGSLPGALPPVPAANGSFPGANAALPAANNYTPPAYNAASNAGLAVPPPPVAMPPVPPPPPAPAPPPPAYNNTPAYNTPTVNNGPAANGSLPGANSPAAANYVASNGMQGAVPSANGNPVDMRAQLADLQSRIEASIQQVNQAIANVQPAPQPAPAASALPPIVLPNANNLPAANTPAANGADPAQVAVQPIDPAKLQAGLLAVQNVLKYVKPGTYNAQDQATVDAAVRRVQQIGQAIAGGADPGQYAAELFTLKHTIIDPSGVGNHPEVTAGAQVIDEAEQQKAQLVQLLQPYKDLAARGQLTPEQVKARDGLVASYKTLTQVEQALDGAKLTKLTATGHQTAGQAIDRLGAAVDAVASGKTDGTELQPSIYRLGQVLKDPNNLPNPSAVATGAAVLQKISNDQARLVQRLGQIDQQIAAGAIPETYAAERADLLDRLGALDELGTLVNNARADQPNSLAAQQVTNGLAKASGLADQITGGGAEPYRPDIFVLKQTLQDPLGSRNNPTIQAGSATLQLIGSAEQKNLQQQAAIQSAISRGADPRGYDQQSTQLKRQQEDLDMMRRAIERVDFGGLTPDQQAQGAQILDQMSNITKKVAAGADFARYRNRYHDLAKQLRDLHTYQPAVVPVGPLPSATGPALGALPVPQPIAPAPRPQPKPVAPAPTPAAQKPTATTTYTVAPGDYLEKIAREKLGDTNRWRELVQLNKGKYPSLETNPNLIQPGWTLQIPTGGSAPTDPSAAGTQPAASKPAPAPNPAPATGPAPTGHARRRHHPHPAAPVQPQAPIVTPAPVSATGAPNQADLDAVAWLKANMGPNGRVSHGDVIRNMPDGPAKQDLLRNFDTLMFGSIDPGRAGWTSLWSGDVSLMDQVTQQGHTLDELSALLAAKLQNERGVTDVPAYVKQLRASMMPGDAPAPSAPANPATPTGGMATPPRTQDQDFQHELDVFLNDPSNHKSSAALKVTSTNPDIVFAATPAQKGRLIQMSLDAGGTEGRLATLQLVRDAIIRNELQPTLEALSQNKNGMKKLMDKMSNNIQGRQMIQLFLQQNAYSNPLVYNAMNDSASLALAKELGFKQGTNVQSDTLKGLPEEAKYQMIRQLIGGFETWDEYYAAQWINQHTTIPYDIPPANNQGQ